MSKQKYFSLGLLLLMFSLPGAGYSQDIKKLDEDIARLTGKITQYPGKAKLVEELSQTYDLANQSDINLIRQLKQTGQPDIWYQVYQANKRIADRQALVRTLPGKTIQAAGLQFVDNSLDLAESKSRAAMYSYALAEKLLLDNTRESARKAYVELLKVARIKEGAYRDLDKLLRKSILAGSTSLEFELQNRTGYNLTADIVGRLNKIVWDYQTSKYGQTAESPAGQGFKFILRVVVTDIDVSADQIKEVVYGEERDLYSGDEVVDTIRCTVNEYRQRKTAAMKGRIDFYDVQLGKVVNTIPIRVESVFTNSYGKLQGNPDAAGEATILLLSSTKADYPSAEEMVLDAAEEFVEKTSEVILSE